MALSLEASFGSSSSASRPGLNLRLIDPWLMVAVVGLCSMGITMVYSATREGLRQGASDPFLFAKKQIMFFAIGFVLMVITALIDYRNFLDLSPALYMGLIVSLLGVFLVPAHKGAHGWYDIGAFQLQPAEFAKIVIILTLAAYGSAQRNELDVRRFFLVLVLAGFPTGLIYLQPDLGSALVLLVIVVVMLWVAGAKASHLGALALGGVAFTAITVKLGILKDYQVKRLTGFIDGSYNVTQSKIAIGSGGISGKGLFEGTQTKYRFLPERHTDFIFSVIGEQLGFIGGMCVLLLFALLCWRLFRIGTTASDTAGALICGGVMALFLFQIFENIGMTLGIMPVTGIPLPFMSYGGSSTIVAFIAIGLVASVRVHRFR